jgi:tRNA pseudouridine55 synthase
MASGVILLLFGDARKLSNYLTSSEKTYETVVRFGRATDSFDKDGETTAETAIEAGWLARDRLERALVLERERQTQLPPTLSAIKVAGRPAHRRVRAGQSVELAPRAVSVKSLDLLALSDESVMLRLCVSKGYYVRALARDLATTLGVPAHLERLRRVTSGAWSIEQAVSWPMAKPVQLVSTEAAARSVLRAEVLTKSGEERARKGQRLSREDFHEAPVYTDDTVAWFSTDGQLVALGRREAEHMFRVVRGMADH